MKKPTHGGARKNAGRKPKEPTVTKRIPVGLVVKIDALIKKYKSVHREPPSPACDRRGRKDHEKSLILK